MASMRTFEKDAIVGEGAYGQVYSGKYLGIPAVIKCPLLKPHDGLSGVQNVKELDALSKCYRHPNIIRLKAVFFEMGATMMIMDKKDSDLHHNTPAFMFILKKWMSQILSALHFLHSQNIAHRDLKPSNILLDKSNEDVFLCDFGISGKSPFEPCSNMTTRGYRSFEIKIKEPYTYACDIWAFGCTFYEIATGDKLFTSKDEGTLISKEMLTSMIMSKKHSRLLDLKENVGPFVDFIHSCLLPEASRPSALHLLNSSFLNGISWYSPKPVSHNINKELVSSWIPVIMEFIQHPFMTPFILSHSLSAIERYFSKTTHIIDIGKPDCYDRSRLALIIGSIQYLVCKYRWCLNDNYYTWEHFCEVSNDPDIQALADKSDKHYKAERVILEDLGYIIISSESIFDMYKKYYDCHPSEEEILSFFTLKYN